MRIYVEQEFLAYVADGIYDARQKLLAGLLTMASPQMFCFLGSFLKSERSFEKSRNQEHINLLCTPYSA